MDLCIMMGFEQLRMLFMYEAAIFFCKKWIVFVVFVHEIHIFCS